MSSIFQQVQDNGYAIVRNLISDDDVRDLRVAIEHARSSANPSAVSNASGVYGLRNLLDVVPEISCLPALPAISQTLDELFDSPAFLVRATLFDKTEGAYWGVFWHQDLSIAVKQKIQTEGFDSWTRKAGVDCVQPPVEIMERIRAVRIHLDDCGADQGALRVLPSTHRMNRLTDRECRALQSGRQEVVCDVCAGDAVIMCPLLLHASSPMSSGTRRRVIHMEFADFALPSHLEWFHSKPEQKSAGPLIQR